MGRQDLPSGFGSHVSPQGGTPIPGCLSSFVFRPSPTSSWAPLKRSLCSSLLGLPELCRGQKVQEKVCLFQCQCRAAEHLSRSHQETPGPHRAWESLMDSAAVRPPRGRNRHVAPPKGGHQ